MHVEILRRRYFCSSKHAKQLISNIANILVSTWLVSQFTLGVFQEVLRLNEAEAANVSFKVQENFNYRPILFFSTLLLHLSVVLTYVQPFSPLICIVPFLCILLPLYFFFLVSIGAHAGAVRSSGACSTSSIRSRCDRGCIPDLVFFIFLLVVVVVICAGVN